MVRAGPEDRPPFPAAAGRSEARPAAPVGRLEPRAAGGPAWPPDPARVHPAAGGVHFGEDQGDAWHWPLRAELPAGQEDQAGPGVTGAADLSPGDGRRGLVVLVP